MPLQRAFSSSIFRSKRLARAMGCRALATTLDFDPEQNLYVFSDPRGGSTWLHEIVSCVPRTAPLWEPLHPHHAPALARLGFSWRQYIPQSDDWPEARAALERTLRGRALNSWSAKGPLRAYREADRLAVKVCRGNALLPWLARQFDFAFAPILLVRHPFAVVASQKAWGAWKHEKFSGVDPDGLDPETPFGRHAAFLTEIETWEEYRTAVWCATTGHALQVPDPRWLTVHYEHLLEDPEPEVNRLFGEWGLPVPESTPNGLHTPSAMASRTLRSSADEQVTKWTRAFTPDEVRRMAAVLDEFGVTHYGKDPYPVAVAA